MKLANDFKLCNCTEAKIFNKSKNSENGLNWFNFKAYYDCTKRAKQTNTFNSHSHT